jgi:hypothetical protein
VVPPPIPPISNTNTDSQTTPTGSSSSASPSVTLTTFPPIEPIITFGTVANASTCGPLPFTWTYDAQEIDPTINMSIYITNDAVQLAHRVRGNIPLNVTVTEGIIVNASDYTWAAVTVPQGWYVLEAHGPNEAITNTGDFPFLARSSGFFIMTGSDVSCLSTTDTGSKHKTDAGALAGGIIGALVGVVALALIGLLYVRRRRSRVTAASSVYYERSVPKSKWGPLDSRDSNPAQPPSRNPSLATRTSETLADMKSSPPESPSHVIDIAALPYASTRPRTHNRNSSASMGKGRTSSVRVSSGEAFPRASYDLEVFAPRRKSLDIISRVKTNSQGEDVADLARKASSATRLARKPVPTYAPSPPSSPPPPSEDLSHKSSSTTLRTFAGAKDGPVHYLMPDLPPPQH